MLGGDVPQIHESIVSPVVVYSWTASMGRITYRGDRKTSGSSGVLLRWHMG